MTERHNNVVEMIAKALLTRRSEIIIKRNSTIKLHGRAAILPERSSHLKPDLWFEQGNTLYIVEVTIPYANITNVNRQQSELDSSDEPQPQETLQKKTPAIRRKQM
jgi:hypothetical protein